MVKLISLAEEYYELQRVDVRDAFARARIDISREQQKLRKIDSNNPLLKLVTIGPDRIDFAHSFKPVVMEHAPIEYTTNLYAAIGHYVQMLIDEQSNPIFGKRV